MNGAEAVPDGISSELRPGVLSVEVTASEAGHLGVSFEDLAENAGEASIHVECVVVDTIPPLNGTVLVEEVDAVHHGNVSTGVEHCSVPFVVGRTIVLHYTSDVHTILRVMSTHQ